MFATEGSNLVLADINLEAAERTAQLINSRFEGQVRAIAARCDVSKESQVEALVKQAVQEFGRLDVMVGFFVVLFSGLTPQTSVIYADYGV